MPRATASQQLWLMKTTVELPDELMRTVKVLAAKEGRMLKDVMAG